MPATAGGSPGWIGCLYTLSRDAWKVVDQFYSVYGCRIDAHVGVCSPPSETGVYNLWLYKYPNTRSEHPYSAGCIHPRNSSERQGLKSCAVDGKRSARGGHPEIELASVSTLRSSNLSDDSPCFAMLFAGGVGCWYFRNGTFLRRRDYRTRERSYSEDFQTRLRLADNGVVPS